MINDHRESPRLTSRLSTVISDPHAQITLTIGLMRQAPLHDNVVRRLQELCDEFNAHGQYLDYEVLYTREIWDLIRRFGQPRAIDLRFELGHWFELGTPMRAVSGVATAAEVASWYTDNGDRIFRRNIRESLGVTQVNAEIGQSLREQPYEFWYRNNGLTMLCERLKLTPRSRSAPHGPATVDAEDVSIVNGAQTVASIAAVVKDGDESVSEALVGIRIIESSDNETSAQITKATNTQNHIERRDFVALDDVQLAIREELLLSLGLTYSIRRSEFEPSPESGCTVREAAIALACAHPEPELALRARSNEDLLWEEGSFGAYSRIFGSRPSALKVWRSVLLLRKVRDSLHSLHAKVEGRAAAIAEQGSLVITHIVFQALGSEGTNDPDYDWDEVLKRVPQLVEDTFGWLTSEVDGQFGPNSFIGSTLASIDRIRPLVQAVMSSLTAGAAAPDPRPRYGAVPKQRAPRSRNSVYVLVDAGVIRDGTRLEFRPAGGTESRALQSWLNEDGRRASATWVNNRSKPLVWAVDGERYTPSGLVMHIYELAEWAGAPVAVQGPSRWHWGNEGSLTSLARAILREADSTVGVDVE